MPRPRFLKLDPARQQEILDTAAAEFAARGYHDASLNRIQASMGLSKGAFYYWFDDKEDLFIATLEQRLGRMIAAVGGVMAGQLTDTPFFEQVRASLVDVFRYAVAHPDDLALLKGSLVLGPDSSPRMAQLWMKGIGVNTAVIEGGQAQGAVRTDLPASLLASLAFGLLESLDRYTLSVHTDVSAAPIEALADLYVGLLVRLLQP